MNYSLTGEDMQKINPDAKIYTYDQLRNFRRLEDLINPCHNKVILLYKMGEDNGSIFGHWVGLSLLNRNGKPRLCYMDSYGKYDGGFIDDVLKYVPKDYIEQSKQTHNYLSELIRRSPINDIHYNQYDYQSPSNQVSTCGRYCSIFLLTQMDIDEFHKFLVNCKKALGGSFDKVIVDLTKNLF